MNEDIFYNVAIQKVESYWDRQPCNLRHSTQAIGTKKYFEEVRTRKYFVEPHLPIFASFNSTKDTKVLEIGCGLGTTTIDFAKAGAKVTAIDLSSKSIELTRKQAQIFDVNNKVTFYTGNCEELDQLLPKNNKYNLVFSFGVLHHTPRPERALKQIHSFLHQDGVLKLMVYNRYSWKVLWVLCKFSIGKGIFLNWPKLIASYSEAQMGCPVTYTYTKRHIRKLLQKHGFSVTKISIEHIFPYNIKAYKKNQYKKVWYFRWLPQVVFRFLERHLGWHLCITAKKQ